MKLKHGEDEIDSQTKGVLPEFLQQRKLARFWGMGMLGVFTSLAMKKLDRFESDILHQFMPCQLSYQSRSKDETVEYNHYKAPNTQESSNWTGNQTFNLSNAGSTPVSCTKYAPLTELAYVLLLESRFSGFDSLAAHQFMQLQSNWIRLFPVTEDDASSNLVGCANFIRVRCYGSILVLETRSPGSTPGILTNLWLVVVCEGVIFCR